MERLKHHVLIMDWVVSFRAVTVKYSCFADSILETMERLQNGVGPRQKSPLLLRDQNRGQEILWEFLTT